MIDIRVIWYGDFESAVVRANTQYAALWLGRYFDRAGLTIWKINLNGDAVDRLVAAAEERAFSVEQVELASLRPIKPSSRAENRTQKAIMREIESQCTS